MSKRSSDLRLAALAFRRLTCRHLADTARVLLLLFFLIPFAAADDGWLLPEGSEQLLWGRENGIVFSIWPGSVHTPRGERDLGGPRGLLRVGYHDGATTHMLNFIAVEPVVDGPRGYSELEFSQLDQVRGKRFWPVQPDAGPDVPPGDPRPTRESARITTASDGAEILEVGIAVERFKNGAEPFLVVRIDSRRPMELSLTVYAASGSADMRQCVLTATMGNFIRARQLWLAGEIIESSRLYPGYTGGGFIGPNAFPREKMLLSGGWRWAAITPDEAEPNTVQPMRGGGWHYRGDRVAQYWRAPEQPKDEELLVRINGRYMYWASRTPIPGGLAFENFELIRPFHPGQEFIFGITRESPATLGLGQ